MTALSTFALGCGCQSGRKDPADSRPNVLFIVIDDLNDWVGCLGGNPDSLTPNMDRLAAKGTLFRNAYASSPLCGPSRAAFLSGMRASTTGLYDNLSNFEDHQILLDYENLPQFLRRRGYLAYGAGKVFHGYYPQYWDDSIDKGGRLYQAGEPKKNGLDIPGIFDWGALDVPDEQMDDYRMAQFAIDKLSQEHEKPFFLACGIYLPHVPYYAPRAYFDKFPLDKLSMPVVKADDTADLPKEAIKVINPKYTEFIDKCGQDKLKEAVQAYLACVNFADAQVGRVLDALEQSPYAHNTIVVLLGDNGLHFGEKNKWHKDSLWAESSRVPFMIYDPRKNRNGKLCDRVVSLLDIYPTLAELTNSLPPSNLEGRSIVPLLEYPYRKWDYPAITNRRKDQTAVRTEKWCYIRYQDGTEELYDYETDRFEWYNLASDGKYTNIKTKLAAYIPPNQV